MSDSRLFLSSLLILISFLLSSTPSEATPNGAPLAACVDMMPMHNTNPQASPPPYELRVTRIDASTLSVSIVQTAGAFFKGFLIQARRDGETVPFGTFDPPAPATNTKTIRCSNTDDSVTHSNNSTKTQVSFTWHAPQGSLAGSRFVATTCLDFITFWVQYRSVDLGDVMSQKYNHKK